MENKKSTKKIKIPFTIMAVLFLIITIVFYASVLKLNLLPTSYIIGFTILEISITFCLMFGMVIKREKNLINVICLIIALLFSGIYIFAINYTAATSKFIENVSSEVTETQEYYVVVNKNSKYNKIEDLENKNISVFNIEEDIKKDVENKVKIEFKTVDSLNDLGNELMGEKIEAILVGVSQYDMLDESIENFKENTKIIYTVTHKLAEIPEVKNEETKNNTVNDEIFNVYISGIDTSGNIRNTSRSDANIMATVNTKTHEVLLTSIPRDYFVTLHSKKAKDKLTHSGIYGINETVTTVEDLLGIDINYYIRVNFSTVIQVVNALGGINVHSDYDFNAGGYHFVKGNNYLNGEQALAFSRERHSFTAGDNQRIKDQQYVIEGIMNKAMSKEILTRYTSVLKSLQGTFQTNIGQEKISKLVKQQISEMPSWKITMNSLTGTGASSSTYSAGSQKLYVMIPNQNSVISAKEKINEVMNSK